MRRSFGIAKRMPAAAVCDAGRLIEHPEGDSASLDDLEIATDVQFPQYDDMPNIRGSAEVTRRLSE